MVQKQLIIDNFQELGYDVDDEVANRCKFSVTESQIFYSYAYTFIMITHLVLGLQLCNRYNIDETSLVDTWVAFSMSGADDMLPTADNFVLMEKKMLSKSTTTPVSSRTSSRSWQDDEQYPFMSIAIKILRDSTV